MSLIPRANKFKTLYPLEYDNLGEKSTSNTLSNPLVLAKWKISGMSPPSGEFPLHLANFGISVQARAKVDNALDDAELDIEYSDDDTTWSNFAKAQTANTTYTHIQDNVNPVTFYNTLSADQDEYYIRFILYSDNGNDLVYAKEISILALLQIPNWATLTKVI